MYVLWPPMPKNYIIITLGGYLIYDRIEQGNNQIWEPTGVSLVQAAAGSNLNSNNSFTTVYSTNSR